MRLTLTVLFFSLLSVVASAQDLRKPDPEAAYVSPDRYTNATFGFSLPLPDKYPVSALTLKSGGNQRLLLGAMVQTAVLTTFTIFASRENVSSNTAPREELEREKLKDLKQVTLGGRPFWRGEAKEKGPAGKMHQVAYVTLADGYLLKFSILSFDPRIADDFVKAVESVTFFDLERAKEIAGPNAIFFPHGQTGGPELPAWNLDTGEINGNVYRNRDLELEFEFPQGWVVNDPSTTRKVRDAGHREIFGDNEGAAREHEYVTQCARDLLYATEHPAGTTAAGLNPMILLMAVNPACGKTQFPHSLEDRDAIRMVAEQITKQLSSFSPVIKDSGQRSRAFMLQGHVMIEVSSDAELKVPPSEQPVPSHLSLLMTELNGVLVVWETATYSPKQLQDVRNVKIAMHK
jgi:hypothetical protein